MSKPAAIVLAAGLGKRMKSGVPKVLHPVCGVPMVEWVIRALRQSGVGKTVLVVGHGADQVQTIVGDSVEYCHQEVQMGTGHAAQMAARHLEGFTGPVLILAGDVPMIRAETLIGLSVRQQATGASAVLATCELEDPTGYGRIVRDGDWNVTGIVEHRDCSADQLSIHEINPAVYCFDSQALCATLPRLTNENDQGEYYLTDVIGLMVEAGMRVEAVKVPDSDEFRGINDRWQLAETSSLVRERIIRAHAASGVTFLDPDSTHIGPDVQIGQDTTIYPNTVIEGLTTIGGNCHVGPNSWIKSCVIGDRVRVFMSHMDQATMGSGSRCGPFANLRPLADLAEDVKIGNFVEIKNSAIGADTSISHLTYVGDAEVGERTNIGAGTITCNYDGFDKHKTVIGDDCFVGSNSTLVAPVAIGTESFVAAGSVINLDVPEGAMAIGRGRQENKEGWFRNWRRKKMEGRR